MSKINCLPFADKNPNIEELPNFLPQIGFRPLTTATPADLPEGALVLLYNCHTTSITTVIARCLVGNKFYYVDHNGYPHKGWENTTIGDKTLENYLFKVIS